MIRAILQFSRSTEATTCAMLRTTFASAMAHDVSIHAASALRSASTLNFSLLSNTFSDSKRGYAKPSLPSMADLQLSGLQPHPGLKKDLLPPTEAEVEEASLWHPIYTPDYVEKIQPQHRQPETFHQKAGYFAVQTMRRAFDMATGYGPNMTEAKWLQRMIFLETVAGVPGMVAGMLRHLKSLRSMERDHGWIHTLLGEAENERMHLLTFMTMRDPGILFRSSVILAQGMFFNMFFIAYLISPKTCHSFVGYLEEEAVKTYTHALEEIDAGRLWKDTPAPNIAINYWKLREDATMRDLILAVRADEACHSHVNHTFSDLKPEQVNPFAVGAKMLP